MSDQKSRGAARLAAVQALYQMELAGGGAEEVADEFVDHRFVEFSDAPDAGFFAAIVTGVPQHQVEIDKAIAACLSQNWTLARVDSILRAILRAAAFELVARRDVPAKVVIDEYVGIARDFFSATSPASSMPRWTPWRAASAPANSACRCRTANWNSSVGWSDG